jgi:hypothetical protein
VAIFYGHLVFFSRFGMLHREKSGNPAHIVGAAIFRSHFRDVDVAPRPFFAARLKYGPRGSF